jgi:hypothetical protein
MQVRRNYSDLFQFVRTWTSGSTALGILRNNIVHIGFSILQKLLKVNIFITTYFFYSCKELRPKKMKKTKNFYNRLQEIFNKSNKYNYNHILLSGDLNARIRNAAIHSTVRSFGEPETNTS